MPNNDCKIISRINRIEDDIKDNSNDIEDLEDMFKDMIVNTTKDSTNQENLSNSLDRIEKKLDKNITMMEKDIKEHENRLSNIETRLEVNDYKTDKMVMLINKFNWKSFGVLMAFIGYLIKIIFA